jgi:asparagine synthase (glutamine-hydrolysing)
MPGIAGVIAKAGVEPTRIARMTRRMLHAPSYVSGTYVHEDLGVHVGWVNHRGSFADCMPLWNQRRDICLVFSGEDFVDAEDVRQLTGRPIDVRSADASYLLALYEAIGPRFIEKLNGWFSGLLIDLRKNEVVLFNDRYGLGRIYYHERPDGFYFASEAKALLEVLPGLRRLDMRSVAETFSCGCVLQNRTLFEGISLLPGGSRWSFRPGKDVTKSTYFDPRVWEQQAPLSKAEFRDQLSATFERITPKYLGRARSVAMSLTGGLDGRMIMAWARPSPGALPCYTFGGTYRTCADVAIGRRIAELCDQPHQTVTVGTDALDQFPSLAEKAVFISDGTMDVTGAVELYANRIASEIAPVRLTGNYGSEIVRGNVAFKPQAFAGGLLEPEFAQRVRDVGATYQGERNCHPLTFIAFKQVPWHHYSRLSVEQSLLTIRSPFLDNYVVSLLYRAPPDLWSSSEPSLRVIKDGNPLLGSLPTDRGLVLDDNSLAGDLRRRWIEFTVKAEYAYDYGMPQRLARVDHALAPLHLERLFLGRHKFYHFRVWYRDKLASYLKEVLLDPRTLERPFFQGRVLKDMVIGHTEGRQNWTLPIHRALTFELLQRQLIER